MPVQWNFEKFLIDKEGNVVNRLASTTTPATIDGRQLQALNIAYGRHYEYSPTPNPIWDGNSTTDTRKAKAKQETAYTPLTATWCDDHHVIYCTGHNSGQAREAPNHDIPIVASANDFIFSESEARDGTSMSDKCAHALSFVK
jgi:hypothetical protein